MQTISADRRAGSEGLSGRTVNRTVKRTVNRAFYKRSTIIRQTFHLHCPDAGECRRGDGGGQWQRAQKAAKFTLSLRNAITKVKSLMRAYDRSMMTPPEILSSRDVERRRGEIDDYIVTVYKKGGQRRAPYWQDFFEDKKFARDVVIQFRNVCAYCERLATPGDGQVHHHRPPALAAQKDGSTELLNYVWLTYEWDNILWVCNTCARHKENRFYAEKPTRETGMELEKLRQTEGELFLDPCFHVPHEHLKFAPNGQVFPRSQVGEETIKLLRLDATDLTDARGQTVGKLVFFLRNPKRAGAYLANDGLGGPSGWIFYDMFEPRLLTHAGAATLALLNWANENDLAGESCVAFLEQLRSMTDAERSEVLVEYQKAASPRPWEGGVGVFVPSLSISNQRVPIAQSDEELETAPPDADQPGAAPFSLTESPVSEARIDTVSIRSFKALKEITLTLPAHVEDTRLIPCAVILGENATGKSSVLEAMTLALLGTGGIERLDAQMKDEDISPDEMRHRPDPENWDVISDDPLEVSLSYYDHEEVTRLSAAANTGYDGPERPAKVLLAYGPRRYFSKRKSRRFRAPRYRVHSLFDPVATIPNPIDWLLKCSNKDFEAAVRALREVLMLSADADVLRDRDQARVLIDTDRGRTPLANLSEGYKSVVAMAADIIRELLYHYDNLENAHAVVLIDEIETHLHPRWKMQIVERLRLAFPRVQFIVTTHDPLCLRGMFHGEVFVLQRDPENRRVESLSDLPDVRGMRAEQILTSEFFGLGSTDPETDARLKRYEVLTTKPDRTPEEEAERDELQAVLSETMAVGDTMREQVFNAAVTKAGLEPFAPMPKVRQESRQTLVDDLVAEILEIEKGFGPGKDGGSA